MVLSRMLSRCNVVSDTRPEDRRRHREAEADLADKLAPWLRKRGRGLTCPAFRRRGTGSTLSRFSEIVCQYEVLDFQPSPGADRRRPQNLNRAESCA